MAMKPQDHKYASLKVNTNSDSARNHKKGEKVYVYDYQTHKPAAKGINPSKQSSTAGVRNKLKERKLNDSSQLSLTRSLSLPNDQSGL